VGKTIEKENEKEKKTRATRKLRGGEVNFN